MSITLLPCGPRRFDTTPRAHVLNRPSNGNTYAATRRGVLTGSGEEEKDGMCLFLPTSTRALAAPAAAAGPEGGGAHASARRPTIRFMSTRDRNRKAVDCPNERSLKKTFSMGLVHLFPSLVACGALMFSFLFARCALYFRETSPRTTDSVRSVPSVPFRIFEEILYGGSEVVHSAVVKYVIFGRFWRGPRKIPLLSRIKQ